MVWMAAQGGVINIGAINTLDKLEFEILEMDKDIDKFYIDMQPKLAAGAFTDKVCPVKNCPPCYKCPGTACTSTSIGTAAATACQTTSDPVVSC
jgi:hypothetical protein